MMMELTISEIAEACGGTLVTLGKNKFCEVNNVVIDSRKAEPEDVFIATVGERVDGHSYIPEVYEKGAALVITEKTPERVQEECGAPASAWGTYLLVENTLQALKDLGEYYRRRLRIPVVGITGSMGKTSTKEFIAGVLGEKYHVLKTEGNYNNEIGVPLTLLKIRKEHTAAVVEMGISEFGEMHRLSKMVRPDICVITNIGQCHLENLRTRDGVLQAKSEIMDFMSPDGQVCFWGGDDKLIRLEAVKRGACREEGGKQGMPHFFGLGEDAREEVWAENIKSQGLFGSDAVLCIRQEDDWVERFFVHIPLPGKHMVINAAAAACVANLLGLSSEEITRGLMGLKATQGRGQIYRYEGRVVIDDCYNANPVSMRGAVDLLSMADGERVAILGDMFELGMDSDAMHGEVGKYAAASGAETILCVGNNARYMYEAAVEEARNRILEEPNRKEQRILWFENLERLTEELDRKAEEYFPTGSTILLKASHGMHFEKLLEVIQKKPE